jgi:hypothetical protein
MRGVWEDERKRLTKVLSEERLRLMVGRNPSRVHTARLAYRVVKRCNKTSPFLSFDESVKEVKRVLPRLKEDELLDVSKMLHVLTLKVRREFNQSEQEVVKFTNYVSGLNLRLEDVDPKDLDREEWLKRVLTTYYNL